MSTNYTGLNGGTFNNSIPGPVDGEDVTGASIALVAQAAANQDKYIADKINGVAYTDTPAYFNGRKRLRPRVPLSDADHTVSVTDGDVFALNPTPAAGRVINLALTSPTPLEGETLTFVCAGLSNANTYSFQRTGPVLIATFYGTVLQNTCPFAVFEFTSGVWRMRDNSGWVQSETQGVLTGPGA